MLGFGLMLTEAIAVFEQPDAVVPITVYEVLLVGETTIGLLLDPLLHV